MSTPPHTPPKHTTTTNNTVPSLASTNRSTTSDIITLYRSLFNATIYISTFGASITFQCIIQEISIPDTPFQQTRRFDYKDARSFLAVAWTLFLIALGISCVSSAVIGFDEAFLRTVLEMRPQERGSVAGRIVAGGGAFAGLACVGCTLGAFFMDALAVSAYSMKTGYVAAGWMGVLGLVSVVLWGASLVVTRRKLEWARR